MECSTCANNGNEPDEGQCAGCFRSTGCEDQWEPYAGAIPISADYVIDDEGC